MRTFGVGFDLRFGDPHGFADGDRLAPRVRRFLADHAGAFGHAFFSFQPRDRALLDAADYLPVWDGLFADVPALPAFGLHHTMLNLGTIDERVDRARLFEVTNTLIDRHHLRWVNEDVGIWAIDGKPLPYPLPPILSDDGLDAAARHVGEVQRALAAPLVIEFPGFEDGTVVGDLDAYDYFRALADRTGAPVTLDTGHLLSWRWLRGHRGAALLADLDRLPLDRCVEIHLSGCQVIDGRFSDVHHGVLVRDQLVLLEALLARCPRVERVTYEDPKLSPDGALRPRARAGFAELQRIVSGWIAEEAAHAA